MGLALNGFLYGWPGVWFALKGLGLALATLANVGFLLTELVRFRAPHLKREDLDVANPNAVGLPHGTVIALGAMG